MGKRNERERERERERFQFYMTRELLDDGVDVSVYCLACDWLIPLCGTE
jgi:hypothetical protein